MNPDIDLSLATKQEMADVSFKIFRYFQFQIRAKKVLLTWNNLFECMKVVKTSNCSMQPKKKI